LRPKTEKFSLHFFDVARPNFFQKGKENFCFGVPRIRNGGSGATLEKI